MCAQKTCQYGSDSKSAISRSRSTISLSVGPWMRYDGKHAE